MVPVRIVLPVNRAAATPPLPAIVSLLASVGPATVTLSWLPGVIAEGLIVSVTSSQLAAIDHAPPPLESQVKIRAATKRTPVAAAERRRSGRAIFNRRKMFL
jgi:hypothetical protein